MFVFILILLLLAAIFGVLGAVLKAVAFSILIGVCSRSPCWRALAYWALKRKARQYPARDDAQAPGKATATATVSGRTRPTPTQLPRLATTATEPVVRSCGESSASHQPVA